MEPLAGAAPAQSSYKENLQAAAERRNHGGPPRYCPVFCGLKDRCITH